MSTVRTISGATAGNKVFLAISSDFHSFGSVNRVTLFLICASLSLTGCSSPDTSGNNRTEEPHENEMKLIGNPGSQSPHLYTSPAGMVYLSWTEVKGDTSTLLFSRRGKDGEWSVPNIIASGTNWFVNWADFPVLTTADDKHLLAHTLRKRSEGTYDYDIWLSRSDDGGSTWKDIGLLHDDGIAAEHGFVSTVPYGSNFLFTWLDGRNTAGEAHHGGHGGAMTLRAAILTPSGEKSEEWELDSRVCDCCQTTAAMTDQGPIVAYRNRSEDEIRDIYVTRWENGQWTTPAPVHDDQWHIEGCPVNGPQLAAKGNSVALAWFSGAEGDPAVKISFSGDAGKTFTSPVTLHQAAPIGRVDVLWVTEEKALVTWMEKKEVKGALVNPSGEILTRYELGSTDGSRASGFPRIAQSGSDVWIATTNSDTERISVLHMKP